MRPCGHRGWGSPVGLPAGPARVTSSLRALKLHADARHHSVAVVLAAAYVLARVWQAAGSAPFYTRDSVDYERIARLPLSGAFASEVKPWGRPLFYKLLPGDVAVTAPIAQLLLSIVAWLALAFAFARCFESRAVRGLAFVSILAFSSSAFVAQWDVVILSESLSLSLYALVLAAALELVRRPRRSALAALLLLALLWSATRDTNTYAFAPIALALLPSLRRRRWLALALACGTVLILAGSASSASNPRRWELVMIDLVDERVLASPDASRYFEAHGMPVPPDLRRRLFVARTPLSRFDRDPALRPFRRWMLRSGRRTYASYLLSHSDEAVREPLSRSGLLLSRGPTGPRRPHHLSPQRTQRPRMAPTGVGSRGSPCGGGNLSQAVAPSACDCRVRASARDPHLGQRAARGAPPRAHPDRHVTALPDRLKPPDPRGGCGTRAS
jgi:hypothetical protein